MPPDTLQPDHLADAPAAAAASLRLPSAALQAQQASQWALEGARGQDRAAALLLRSWGTRLVRYAMQHGRVTESVAEELAADAILQFVLQPAPPGCAAEVWLWALMRHGLIDHARAQDALKRGGRGGARGAASQGRHAALGQIGHIEVALDDEAWLAALDHLPGHVELAPWVRECVHKAAALMERDEPRHAQVLWMVAQGWSAQEIAVHFGARPDAVDERQRSAARDRVYRACRCAREHFAHCQE
jgi:DNA-directed RNA polymerase specialized sigma24 family protein